MEEGYDLRKLAGYAAGRFCSLLLVVRRRFGACQHQIALQNVKDSRGQFIAPFILLVVAPIAIQTDGIVEIFWKGLAVAAFAYQRVAELAARGSIVNTPSGRAAGI